MLLVVVRSGLGLDGFSVPDDLELEGVRGFHRREDGLSDQFVGREGLAGQDDLVGRQLAARGNRRHPTALDILPQDLPLVGFGQFDVAIAGEADAQVIGVDEGVEVRDDGQAGCDPLGVVQPARELLLTERAFRLPVRSEIAANGWTTQAGRLSQLVPAVDPFVFEPRHAASSCSLTSSPGGEVASSTNPYPTHFTSVGKPWPD